MADHSSFPPRESRSAEVRGVLGSPRSPLILAGIPELLQREFGPRQARGELFTFQPVRLLSLTLGKVRLHLGQQSILGEAGSTCVGEKCPALWPGRVESKHDRALHQTVPSIHRVAHQHLDARQTPRRAKTGLIYGRSLNLLES